MTARRSLCKFCNQPVVWVRTEGGRMMPIDPMPHASGNVVAMAAGDRGPRARVLTTSMQADPQYADHVRFMPHAASCTRRPGRRPQPTPTEDGSLGHEEASQ